MNISIDLSFGGFVHCLALKGTVLSSVPQLLTDGVASSFSTNVNLHISGLNSLTEYDIFCGAESIDGTFSDLEDVLGTKTTVLTPCCKKLFIVTHLDKHVRVGDTLFDFLEVFAEQLPSSAVSVNVTVFYNDSDSTDDDQVNRTSDVDIFPSESIMIGSSLQNNVSLSLQSLPRPGFCWINAVLWGPASAEYEIAFVGKQSFRVMSYASEPDVPQIMYALFSADGISITLYFDAATDTAGGGFGIFPCSQVLYFLNSNITTCRWVSSTKLLIMLTSFDIITVGDNITVAGGIVRAECTSDGCSDWQTMNRTVMVVSPPQIVMKPQLSIVFPELLGVCDDLTADISSSTGTLGRVWSHFSMTLVSYSVTDANIAPLQMFLSSVGLIHSQELIVIPRHYFDNDNTYTFQISVENFLGGYAEKRFSVSVLSTVVPTLAIRGPSHRTVTSSLGVSLTADASTATCSSGGLVSSISREGIVLTWDIFDAGGYPVVDLISSSDFSHIFKLSPYSLNVNEIYRIVATAFDINSKASASAAVTFKVKASEIVATISQGVAISLPNATDFDIDGSSSYDKDLLSTPVDSFAYVWSCITLSPNLDMKCPFVFRNTKSESILKVHTSSTQLNVTAKVSLFISSVGGRTSTANILITIIGETSPYSVINLNNQDVNNIDPRKKLSVIATLITYYSCNMIWSVKEDGFENSDDVDIESISLSSPNVALVIPPNELRPQRFSANLVLKGGALLGDTKYRVTLSCANSEHHIDSPFQTITVFTNNPPVPGDLILSPQDGFALSTVFKMNAVLWEDSDIPLRYDFTQMSNSLELPIQQKSEVKSVETLLSVASSLNEYLSEIKLCVFDGLDASTHIIRDIRVLPGEVATFSRKLSESSVTFSFFEDSDGIYSQNQIALALGTLNAINCTLAPNCTSLHRRQCVNIPHTCGICNDGYVGDIGSENTVCIKVRDAKHFIPGKYAARSLIGFSSCAECLPWEQCFPSTTHDGFACIPKQKNCSDPSCSGHGVCHRVLNSHPHSIVESCLVGSIECQPRCFCDPNFFGSLCTYNFSIFRRRIQLRYNASLALLRLIQGESIEEGGEDVVYGHIDSLVALFLIPEEISEETAVVALDVIDIISVFVQNIIATTSKIFIYENMVKLLQPLHVIMDIYLRHHRSVGRVHDIIDLLGYFMAVDMTVGEQARNIVIGSIRIQICGYNAAREKSIFRTALSSYEEALGVGTDSIQFDSLILDDVTDIIGWLTMINSSSVINNDGNEVYGSDILGVRMIFAQSKTQAIRLFNGRKFTTTLLNKLQASYTPDEAIAGNDYTISITTQCHEDDITSDGHIVLTCPDTSYRYSFFCEDIGMHTLYCPQSKLLRQPRCAHIDGQVSRDKFHTEGCSLKNFDEFRTSCSCSISKLVSRDHETRSLPSSLELGAVTLSYYSVDEGSVAEADFVTSLPLVIDVKETSDYTMAYTLLVVSIVTAAFAYVSEYLFDESCAHTVKKIVPSAALLSGENTKYPSCTADGIGNLEHACEFVERSLPFIYSSEHCIPCVFLLRELTAHHKWVILLKLFASPFLPSLHYQYNFLLETFYLFGDLASAAAALVMVYIAYDKNDLNCAHCMDYNAESNCTFSSVAGYDALGSTCEWDATNLNCSLRSFSGSLWSVSIAVLITTIISAPFSTISRYILKHYIFATTARTDQFCNESNKGLLKIFPCFVCEWFIERFQLFCVKNAVEKLQRYGLSNMLLAVMKQTKLDSLLLKEKIHEFSRSMMDDADRENFLTAWGIPLNVDCNIEESLNFTKNSDFDAFQCLFKRSTNFDVIMKRLFRVNLLVAKEARYIVHEMQFHREPLSEVRALVFLVQDIISDECNHILQIKRDSDDRVGKFSVTPKSIEWRLFSLVIILWYFWGCGYLVYYYMSTRCERLHALYISSFILWLMIDITLFQTVTVILKEFIIPMSINDCILRVKALIARCICELDSFEKKKSKFEWSLLLYSSARIASKFYDTRLVELILVLFLSGPLRSKEISSYSRKAILRLNVNNCDSNFLVSADSLNWEFKNFYVSFWSAILSCAPFSDFIIELISGFFSCTICLCIVITFLNPDMSVLVISIAALLLILTGIHTWLRKHVPHPIAKSATERKEDMLTVLGRKAYFGRLRKMKKSRMDNAGSSNDSGSIVHHESVICDDFSFDVVRAKTEAMRLIKNSSLYTDDFFARNDFFQSSSLFDNLYNSEIIAMMNNNSNISVHDKCANVRDPYSSLFGESADKKELPPNLDKVLVSGLTSNYGDSMAESLTTYHKPTGLFDSSAGEGIVEDCSLFSDKDDVACSDKITPQSKAALSDAKYKSCRPWFQELLRDDSLLQEIYEDKRAPLPSRGSDNNEVLPQENLFEREISSCAYEENSSIIPPEISSFMNGKSHDEKLQAIFKMAELTVKNSENGAEESARNKLELTKDQLLEAVLKKKLKGTRKSKKSPGKM